MSASEFQLKFSGEEPDFAFGEVYGIRQWRLDLPKDLDNYSVTLGGHFRGNWELGAVNEAKCLVRSETVRTQTVLASYAAMPLFDDGVRDAFLRDLALRSLEEVLERRSARGLERPDSLSKVILTVEPQPEADSPVQTRAPGMFIGAYYSWPSIQRAYYLSALDGLVPGFGPLSHPDNFDKLRGYKAYRIMVSFEVPKADSRPAAPACTCGYYAYTSREGLKRNQQTHSISTYGLIKGYGHVTQGTLGFRCAKAEIVALTKPYVLYNGTTEVSTFVGLQSGLAWLAAAAVAASSMQMRPAPDTHRSAMALSTALKNTNTILVRDLDALIAVASERGLNLD